MRKVSDRTTVGLFAGVIGGLSGYAVTQLLYRVGFGSQTWDQEAAGATVAPRYQHAPRSGLVGLLGVISISALWGVPHAYLLSFTGRDHLMAKNLGYGALGWFGVHGLGGRLSSRFNSSPATSAAALIGNLVTSIVQGNVIARIGANEIFVDARSKGTADEVDTLGTKEEQPVLTQ